ncbi:MAG: biosynthetic-type acetolactate synthase large subunit [Halanaerobiales bacterium]
MSTLTGAEIVIESLKEEDVEIIFGYPGGAVIPIYDVLYDSELEHYLTRHEQAAAHAADGYARSTGKVGVCIATSGPGATNLVTGLATAYMDSSPVVAFTGQVPTEMIGSDAFQEADTRGITLPITRENYLVTDVEDLAKTIKEAFYLARTGRPGPVLIDLPKDVSLAETEYRYPKKVNLPGYKPNFRGHDRQITKAAEAINEAERPLLYVGGGAVISGAEEKLRELAGKAQIPVTTTLMALGVYPEDDPLSLGMLGMHGTTEANLAMSNADLIIAAGARFDDRATGDLDTFGRDAKIIHIDIDPAEIDKLVPVDLPLVGDVRYVLKELLPLIKEMDREQWLEKISEWRELDKDFPENQKNPEYTKLTPREIIEEVYDLTEGNALLTTEVGQHQMWAAQYYKFSRPRSLITSGGLGTMGYGFPAAIGVKVGNPDETVICIAGDGSFQMNIQELATVAKNDIPVKVVILNNQYLGMVRQWQELFFDKRYSATCLRKQKDCPPNCSSPGEDCPVLTPDFVKVAEGYGVAAKRVTEAEDIRPALKEALDHPGPYILDFIIEEEFNVYPMVPAGGSLNDMLLEGDSNN